MCDIDSLWGEEFVVPDKKKEKEKVKQIKEKIAKPKKVKTEKEEITKSIKSKSISLEHKLELITNEVNRVLGKQKDNVVCLRSREELHEYISQAISFGRLAIDTETNNSLEPITCKLMGLCLYFPGAKQAYIPVNHRNKDTKELLPNQVTENDIKEELQRVYDANTFVVTHNGKFDYQVLKCTCGVLIHIDWDTLIGAKLLDENELRAGLKLQYIDKIDPDQEKYDIEHLFSGVEYADVDPEIFAMYSATDSYMTDKLYEWQMEQFTNKDLAKVYKLATELEMPLCTVIAEMELAGMDIDQNYALLLSNKYHHKLDICESKLKNELDKLKPQIEAWRQTPEANFVAPPAPGDYDTRTKSKSKNEQLPEEINTSSSMQLAILLYDVLKLPKVNLKKPRATGEDELVALNKIAPSPLFDLLIEKRGLTKLLSTYIDSIPQVAKENPDGRVRTHFNAYGAVTGRLSSSKPVNFQNIPSGEKSIRLLFTAKTDAKLIEEIEPNTFIVYEYMEVETDSGWVYAEKLIPGSKIKLSDEELVSVISVEKCSSNQYRLIVE